MIARTRILAAAALAAPLLAACVSMPTGPSVMVLPGTGKSFDQFRADDYECRQFASSQLGGSTAEQAQENSAVKSAAIGTAVGAAAGALLGGKHGAAGGAAGGLIVGSAAGAGTANSSGYGLQRRYDMGYQQCMYAKGHRVPVAEGSVAPRRSSSTAYTSQPPASTVPPPPPGTPPPPPPGAK